MPTAFDPAAWSPFFSAQVGASAALAGLIFVAISINLPKIMVGHQLIPRCAQALFILMGVLLASTFCLVPGQSAMVLGSELAGLGALVWIAATICQWVAAHKNPYVRRRQRVLHMMLTQFATVPCIASGISMLAHRGGGLDWLFAGTVFSFITALVDAWVLLIEIQR